MRRAYKITHDTGRINDAILRRLSNGTLEASCRTAIFVLEKTETRKAYYRVSPKVWAVSQLSSQNLMWESGDIDIYADGQGQGYVISASNEHVSLVTVRFDPIGLADLFPQVFADQIREISANPEAPAVTPKNPGGRPRAGWWDDLWHEVVRQIASGSLNGNSYPSASQFEIHLIKIVEEQQKATKFSPGDSTLKPMSLKLFKMLRENGGK